jgi:phosphate transport system substrate-binding protein
MNKTFFLRGKSVCVALLAIVCLASPSHAQLSGAGSSLARDVLAGWSTAFGAAVGGVTYEAVGSSRGVDHAKAGEVDFGVSDVPLTGAALRQSNLKQIPLAASAVVIAINVPELANQQLRLTGDILASIYTGKIEKWNHSQIAGVNPGVKLPDRAIVPVWRSDGSGQSYVFSTYLSRQNSAWRRATGTQSQLRGLSGRSVVGGASMLATIRATPGAIGYEGYAGARSAGLVLASLRNASEQYVAPTPDSITEALAKARWSFDTAENAADLDASAGAAAYPLTAVIYALVPTTVAAPRKNASTFLARAVQQGDSVVTGAGFLPLPAAVKTFVANVAKAS